MSEVYIIRTVNAPLIIQRMIFPVRALIVKPENLRENLILIQHGVIKGRCMLVPLVVLFCYFHQIHCLVRLMKVQLLFYNQANAVQGKTF
ncbi:hypothetical protein MGMO_83c00020 [Methyloglobulus morosus KoM1]|uniref:Uncharacterized protein n=1 Tax=Methyloglobulus morosus KoM1 TaxID=1116472 RepID=V5BVM6_9GAMM|nr:hypothetical protein MGMO_83c00020 [Methyloglobulus morosus KoM1]